MLIPLCMPGSVYSSSVSWDGCGWMFPDELRVSSFLSSFPTLCLNNDTVSPLQLHWVKGVCMFRCNLPPVLMAEWLESFMCHCSTTGLEQTSNKSQHTKLTLEKKIFPPLLSRFELASFGSWIQRSANKLFQCPYSQCVTLQSVCVCVCVCVWRRL